MSQADTETPWLSVLIPVYNVQDYLVECVESVMNQASDGVELILLDDCSTDRSPERMAALAQRWPGRLRLMRHACNQGLSGARNTMLEAARGEHVWFLDSDDKLLPGAIAGLSQVILPHAPDLVLCDFETWWPDTDTHMRQSTFKGAATGLITDPAALITGLLLQGEMHIWTKICKRSVWLNSGLRFPKMFFEDMAISPRLALQAHASVYVPQPWVAYRQRAGSFTAQLNPTKLKDWSRSLRAFRHDLDVNPLAGNAQVHYALSDAAARNLRSVLRAASRDLQAEPAETIRQLARQSLNDFEAVAPLTPAQLQWAYVRRGRLSAWRQLRRALQRQRRLARS